MHALALIYEVRDKPGVRAFKFIQEEDLSLELQLVAGPELTEVVEQDIRSGLLRRDGSRDGNCPATCGRDPAREVGQVPLRREQGPADAVRQCAGSAPCDAPHFAAFRTSSRLAGHAGQSAVDPDLPPGPPAPDPMFPGEVDASRFDSQMALVRRYCSPLPLREAVAGLSRTSCRPGCLRHVRRWICRQRDRGAADPVASRRSRDVLRRAGFLDGGRMWNDSIIETLRRAPAGPRPYRVRPRETLGDPAIARWGGRESISGP